ncbi:dehydrogenase [Variovorax sp. WS11]|uniref:FAD-dependent oxidoreductase n=1 Tax=Variovorax sp. WS11 TaxID=1105204 RepID=UPI000D0DC6CE|nr:FAD-dependent oxidoreductase [Variovorax sp. WS11]NDZ18180.1 FAD-dependent oxidoreductase [Variovorax sp. WS11]PSL80595.1 dehydrogenase [Variovorax sp. WS11]
MIETDVVVIGSGAAGLTAAITARASGLEVLVLEKTDLFGGTTAYSGGAPWIPCNHVMKQIGLDDSRAAAQTYLRAVLGEAYDEDLVGSYLDNAAPMLAFMERHSQVRFKPFPLPDYESELPGAARSRSLLTQAFDGRLLGARLADLRMPLPQLMLFGSMQIEGADIHPMRHALKTWAGFTHTAKVMRRFVADKLRHGRGTRLVNGNALAGRLFHSAIEAGVTLWKNTPALELIVENGSVRGVVAQREFHRIEVRARKGVLLATGGYGANERMRAKYIPFAEHHHSLQPEGNVGDGIQLGLKAGAVHDPAHAGDCIWTPVSLLRKPDGSVVKYPHIFIDRAMPGCIAVDPQGRRFVNEGTSYQTFVGTMHQRGFTQVHLVANREFVKTYGLGLARPHPFNPQPFVDAGYLLEAATLAELAGKIGADPAQLEATVQRFDEAARRGEDPEFGKGADAHSRFRGDQTHQPNPSVAPVGPGPYYAVVLYPGDLSTVGGLDTNGRAQVLNGQRQPIPGLYAAGLDMNSMMRGRYPGGGSSIGPAMTFGYIAARHMAQRQTLAERQPLAAMA